MSGTTAGAFFLCAFALGILLHYWLEQRDEMR